MGHFAVLEAGAPASCLDLATLVASRKAPVISLQVGSIEPPAGLEILQRGSGVQMVFAGADAEVPSLGFLDLGSTDAPEMLALAQLTKPGPFEPETYRLGQFIGVRHEGHLVAMAGQRMAFPGWVEISGVCVHPDFRGRGLAQRLVMGMVRQLLDQGTMPFLHTYADNTPAIRLYEQLGFEIRTSVNLAVMG
ncbi:MAG: GNAT family N-acetyltransferase [Pseudomonadota bacterium]